MWRKILIVVLSGLLAWSSAAIAVPVAGTALGRAIPHPGAGTLEQQGRRVALVIGNDRYPERPLAHAAGDARAVDRMLTALGFDVMRYENLDRRGMEAALQAFGAHLEAGGTGLFYFAGHGFQAGDHFLLASTEADSRLPARLVNSGLDLRAVIAGMSASRPDMLNLIVLDTCLDDPFRNGARGDARTGFPALPPQTLLAYATAPGSAAADGVYTAALLQAMATPGRDLREVFGQTALAVRAASAGRQRPWVVSTVTGEFRFIEGPGPASARPVAGTMRAAGAESRGILPKDSAEQYELTFWDSIKDSEHISDYEAYLQTYPNGRFAALARARIARLRAVQAKPEKQEKTEQAEKAEKPKEEVPAAAPKPAHERKSRAAAPSPKAQPQAQAQPPASKEAAAPREGVPPVSKSAGAMQDCAACPAMVALPAGSFTMGSKTGDPSEKPPHRVVIDKPFAIGKYEVTVEQWKACVQAGACPRIASADAQAANSPMRDVSWDDAQQYVKWLSKVSGKTYRLPTEAEWEYAARGGTSTRYWWGEQMSKGKANCKDCGDPWQAEAPAPVGSFAANPYGLHDVNGSVWEWVSDCWHNSYKGAPADGSAWSDASCRVRVIRGGSWREGESYMPSSTRFKYDASVRHSQNGFRVVRVGG